MAVTLDLDASRRLLDQLESSRMTAGEGLVGDTKTPVPREVSEAFRKLVEEGPDALGGAQAADRSSMTNAADAAQLQPQGVDAASGIGRVDGVGSDLDSDRVQSADGTSSAGAVDGASSRIDGPPLPGPEELIAMQFHMGMHSFQTKTLSKVRDQAVQNFEQTLKSTS